MGWQRLTYTTDVEIMNALSDLVTVTSRDASGYRSVMGTAFPVLASNTHVVLITARHVIEAAFQNSAAAQRRSTTSNFDHLPGADNALYEEIGKWVSHTDDLNCLITLGGRVINCDVIGSCLRPPIDIAFIIVQRVDIMGKDFPVFSINSDPLKVGQRVVATSFVTSKVDGTTIRELSAKIGDIVRIRTNGRLAKAPVYETNIPIEKGASGGPVFLYRDNFFGEKQVIGVVSSDFSSEEAFKDESIDGHSHVSMIASAAPLGLRDATRGEFNFQDLCLEGLIADRGSAMKYLQLKFFRDGNWHQKVPT